MALPNYKQYQNYYQTIIPILGKPEAQKYYFLSLALFIIAVLALFAIRPTLITIISLNNQIKDGQVLEKKLQDKINALSLIQVGIEANKTKIAQLNTTLPDEPKVFELVHSLESPEDKASNSSQILTTLSGASPSSNVALAKSGLPLTFAFGGSDLALPMARETNRKLQNFDFVYNFNKPFDQIQAFLSRLLTLPRFVALKSFEINLLDQELIRASLKASAYYSK